MDYQYPPDQRVFGGIIVQMASGNVINLKGEEFEEVPPIASLTSKWLADAWVALGRPETPLSDAGQKLMELIIAYWEELFPKDAIEWKEVRSNYKLNEMSITEQVQKHTGRSLASYPYPIYAVMKRMFPKFKATERENCLKMVRKYPMFKFANKA